MNNDALISILLSFLAGISTMIGTVPIFFKIKRVEEFTVFSLSLSMFIMLFISFFDLLPKSIIILNDEFKLLSIIIIILCFFLGYLTVYVIEEKINNGSSLYKIGILSFISLLLHNFPEGIAVFMSAYKDLKIGIKMCISIMLHNIPEGIAISVPLYYSNKSREEVLKLTFISGIAEPLGALLSYIFLKNIINDVTISLILIFVSGLMISLSINHINKEINLYNKKTYKIYGLLVGLILSLLLSVL